MNIFHNYNTYPNFGICETMDIPPVPSSNKITAQAAIIDQTEPAPIKCRKSKFKIPHITKHNLHKGSGRTNNQILNDILRIIDRYIVPLDQNFMIEEILKYSTDIPELRESGLPWMKEDFKIQKTKYMESCKHSKSQDEKRPFKVNKLELKLK